MLNVELELVAITGDAVRVVCWDAQSAIQHTTDCVRVVLKTGRLLHKRGWIIRTWKVQDAPYL